MQKFSNNSTASLTDSASSTITARFSIDNLIEITSINAVSIDRAIITFKLSNPYEQADDITVYLNTHLSYVDQENYSHENNETLYVYIKSGHVSTTTDIEFGFIPYDALTMDAQISISGCSKSKNDEVRNIYDKKEVRISYDNWK
ncbi:hypothetical protein [Parabacteroides merdae]|uniref:hypothetical protein n=1 Tax=Parabacteroides merdae TaxID=46503 RepID=UPI0034A244CA